MEQPQTSKDYQQTQSQPERHLSGDRDWRNQSSDKWLTNQQNFERRKLSRNKEKILFSGAFQKGIYELNEKTGFRAF